MRGDQKWQSRLSQAREDGGWGVLDVYSDEVQMEQAHQQPLQNMAGWLGAQMEDSLEVWAEGADDEWVVSLKEMDSTRAELLGAYAVLHKVRQWRGTVRIIGSTMTMW